MLFVLQFRDNPEKLHLRQQLMPAHLEFLRGRGEVIRTAGSMRRESDDGPVGGIWIVEAASFEEAKQCYLDDPFWTAGLRASVEIHRLAKAFSDIARTV